MHNSKLVTRSGIVLINGTKAVENVVTVELSHVRARDYEALNFWKADYHSYGNRTNAKWYFDLSNERLV